MNVWIQMTDSMFPLNHIFDIKLYKLKIICDEKIYYCSCNRNKKYTNVIEMRNRIETMFKFRVMFLLQNLPNMYQ